MPRKTKRDLMTNQVRHQEFKKFPSSKVTDTTKDPEIIDDNNQNGKDLRPCQSQCSDFTFNKEKIVTKKLEDFDGKNSKTKAKNCTDLRYYTNAKRSLSGNEAKKSASLNKKKQTARAPVFF